MARPKKAIDVRQVVKLAELHCNDREIAAVVGVSEDTLHRRFAEEIDKARARCKTSLRRVMWRTAMKGNVTMLIWLGKQYLGQTDRAATEVTGASGGPVAFTDADRDEVRRKLARLAQANQQECLRKASPVVPTAG